MDRRIVGYVLPKHLRTHGVPWVKPNMSLYTFVSHASYSNVSREEVASGHCSR